MPETQVTVRQATDADLPQVTREVLNGARTVPGIGSRALGWLIPRPVLSRIYSWLIGTGRGEIWIAESPTALAAVVLLRRAAQADRNRQAVTLSVAADRIPSGQAHREGTVLAPAPDELLSAQRRIPPGEIGQFPWCCHSSLPDRGRSGSSALGTARDRPASQPPLLSGQEGRLVR